MAKIGLGFFFPGAFLLGSEGADFFPTSDLDPPLLRMGGGRGQVELDAPRQQPSGQPRPGEGFADLKKKHALVAPEINVSKFRLCSGSPTPPSPQPPAFTLCLLFLDTMIPHNLASDQSLELFDQYAPLKLVVEKRNSRNKTINLPLCLFIYAAMYASYIHLHI